MVDMGITDSLVVVGRGVILHDLVQSQSSQGRVECIFVDLDRFGGVLHGGW